MSKNFSTMEPDSKRISSSIPFFSIGVTTYNRPELLKQTITSIIAQTFVNFEVIVGNDYIQEPLSADVLGINDPRIRFVNHPRNFGEAPNMNTLLDLSRGHYFTWQCDDDLYAPNFLEEVYSVLIKYNLPPCVFTSYEFIYGASFPDLTKTISGKEQILSGRQFLRNYWSGTLKAMGCTGVYDQAYLKRIGGVECLADTTTPLYSEHLLLVQAGLLKDVVHIDEPLIKYRIHEGAWGCTTTDILLYRQVSQNLVRECIAVFSDPKLRDDFSQNIASVLEFVVYEFFNKNRAREGCLSRHESIPFFFSLKKQFNSLKGSELYRIALINWVWAGVKLVWWLSTKFNLKAVIFPLLSKYSYTLRSFFRWHRKNSEE